MRNCRTGRWSHVDGTSMRSEPTDRYELVDLPSSEQREEKAMAMMPVTIMMLMMMVVAGVEMHVSRIWLTISLRRGKQLQQTLVESGCNQYLTGSASTVVVT